MSGGGTNTVQSTSVPGWLQPYLTQSLTQGQQLLSQGGPQMQQGVAPMNALQNQGVSSIAGAAGAPNANDAANTALSGILGGQNLGPNTNPYLAQTFQTGANQIQNQLSSEFAGAGSNVLNSLPVQQNAMSDLAGSIYAPAYAAGLNQQTQAAALAPAVAQGQYLPGQEELQTGAGLQGQAQNVLTAQNNEYNYAQQLPYQTQSWYSSLVGQNASPFGSSSSQSNPVTNPWVTGAGGALAGAAGGAYLGSQIGSVGGPMGMGIGAAAGGLLGAFG